ncbi:MAG: ATP-binding cassette domain-containing protein [Clostridia bacterium]|nr:ATP-binding cassette domain-containing protein [Clostridia bacterium]
MSKTVLKTPVIYQMEAAECGAAALASVLLFFGRSVPADQLRADTRTSLGGSSAGDLMRAAEKYGLGCHGYKLDASELRTLKAPAIIHWNDDHFVVFEGFKRGYGYINDPALGRYRLPFDELAECFSGVALTFEPGPDPVPDDPGRSQRNRKPAAITEEHISYCTVLTLLGFILAFSGLAFPACAQILADRLFDDAVRGPVTAGIMLLAAVLFVVSTIMRERFLDAVGNKARLTGGRELMLRLFKLPLRFYSVRNIMDLAGRIGDLNENVELMIGTVSQTVTDAAALLIYFTAYFIYSPMLALIALTAAALITATEIISEKTGSPDPVKLRRDRGRLAGTIISGLSLTGTLKANGAEDKYVSGVLDDNYALHALLKRRLTLNQLLKAVPTVIKIAGAALIMTAGSVLTARGKISAGMLAALLLLYFILTRPLRRIARAAGAVRRIELNKMRIDDVMSQQTDERFSVGKGKELSGAKLNGRIVLKNVNFGYAPEKPVLRGIDLTLESGSYTYILGDSGSGKTTLAKLMTGLYAPRCGQIRYGRSTRDEISPEAFSASISFCGNAPVMFSGSIRDNITMLNHNVREADMISAAKDACIHEFIAGKPGAYGYCLNESASNLSTGQKQRLGIARALAVNPSVLVMDEALTAVDPVTGKQIIDNIRRRGCTLVITGKQAEQARGADRVLVISEGVLHDRPK